MYKLLITDLDDTLYSWIDFFVPAFYEMVRELSSLTGIEEETLLREYQEQHRMVGTVEFPFITLRIPSINRLYLGLGEDEIKERLNSAFHKFNSVRKHQLKLFEGVDEVMQKISEAGIIIIGYTESAEENGFYRLKKLCIEKYFSKLYVSESQYQMSKNTILSSKTETVKGKKPNPEILTYICAIQNMKTSDAIYMGDSLTKDIYMAKKAGIKSIQVKCQQINPENYKKLVAISHWTEDDFDREQNLKETCQTELIKPDYEITNFSELAGIMGI